MGSLRDHLLSHSTKGACERERLRLPAQLRWYRRDIPVVVSDMLSACRESRSETLVETLQTGALAKHTPLDVSKRCVCSSKDLCMLDIIKSRQKTAR